MKRLVHQVVFPRPLFAFAQVDLEGLESDFGSRALSFTDFRHAAAAVDFGGQMKPYAPCTEYLPTFALEITQMSVNIPYMEHMGKGGQRVAKSAKKQRSFP